MRRTRWAGLVLATVLVFGGLTACGGDDDGGDVPEGEDSDSGSSGETDTTEATPDDGGEPQEFSEGVEGYCEAVNAYVALLGEAIDDPESAGAELQAAANAYLERAVGLGELSAEEQARFDECSQQAAEAAADLVPSG